MALRPAFNQQRAKGDAQALGSLFLPSDNAFVRGEKATRLAHMILSEPDYAKRGELLAAFVREVG